MKLSYEYEKEEFIAIHETIKDMWGATLQLGVKALDQNRILTERKIDLEHAKINLQMKQMTVEAKAKKQARPSPINTKTFGYNMEINDAE